MKLPRLVARDRFARAKDLIAVRLQTIATAPAFARTNPLPERMLWPGGLLSIRYV